MNMNSAFAPNLRVSPHALNLRAFGATDRSAVGRLLRPIGTWYPGGETWLQSRLDDALGGMADCILALDRGLLAGIAIQTEKGRRRRKLSTIYVAPHLRGRGIGSTLFEWLERNWCHDNVDAVHLTVDSAKRADIAFFGQWGFREHFTVPGLYWPDRTETIMTWDPYVGDTLVAALHQASVCGSNPLN